MKKRIFSILLTICMVVALMPVTANAEGIFGNKYYIGADDFVQDGYYRYGTETNEDHIYEWQSENGQYWQKCQHCGHETAHKDIPEIDIIGADKVSTKQDYTFTFTLPEGVKYLASTYEFPMMGSEAFANEENGVYSVTIKTDWYDTNDTAFDIFVHAETADGFTFSVRKTITLIPFKAGDLNSDGTVDSLDMLIMSQYILNITDNVDITLADLDGDNTISASDILMLQMQILYSNEN